MNLFKFFRKKPWTETYAKVENWMPSSRPKFRNKITGQTYTLSKVNLDGSVVLQASCGKTSRKSKPDFERNYIRV